MAPPAASSRAIAAPMPLLLPVTSATRFAKPHADHPRSVRRPYLRHAISSIPCRCIIPGFSQIRNEPTCVSGQDNIATYGANAVGIVDRYTSRAAVDALDQPVSTSPAPISTKVVTPAPTMAWIEAVQRTLPVSCAVSSARMASTLVSGCAGRVADHRHRRRSDGGGVDGGAQCVGGRPHERAVRGDADRQRHDLACARRSQRFHGRLHAGAVAGDDDLAGTVVVGHLRDAAGCRNFGADVRPPALRPVPGRPPSCPARAFTGFLHQAAALANQAQTVGIGEAAGRDQGRVLAHAVAGHEVAATGGRALACSRLPARA